MYINVYINVIIDCVNHLLTVFIGRTLDQLRPKMILELVTLLIDLFDHEEETKQVSNWKTMSLSQN